MPSDSHSPRVWDLASGELQSKLEGHTGNVNSVAISPDNNSIVSGSDDMTVRCAAGAACNASTVMYCRQGHVPWCLALMWGCKTKAVWLNISKPGRSVWAVHEKRGHARTWWGHLNHSIGTLLNS